MVFLNHKIGNSHNHSQSNLGFTSSCKIYDNSTVIDLKTCRNIVWNRLSADLIDFLNVFFETTHLWKKNIPI